LEEEVLACDRGGAEVEHPASKKAHQQAAASSPKGSRGLLLRSGFTSRDSWKRTRCVRYLIAINIGRMQCLPLVWSRNNTALGKLYSFLLVLHLPTPASKRAGTTTLQRNTASITATIPSCHVTPSHTSTHTCVCRRGNRASK
jgi:hypothetical protein